MIENIKANQKCEIESDSDEVLPMESFKKNIASKNVLMLLRINT